MTAQPFKTKVLQSTFPDYWGSLASANQRNVALEIKATVSRDIAISGFPTVARIEMRESASALIALVR